MAEAIPHLTIEELDAAARVLQSMRPMGNEPNAEAYRLVLTDVHQVIRNARDLSNGN